MSANSIDHNLKHSWTYSELFRRVVQLRDFILQNEMCPSERIALYAFNGIESLASLCALFILPRTAVLLRSSFNYRE
ncbi:4-coumarate--CoA ligase 7-like [Tropilaelaps mercedesae]|uniref:4-coumarate--CoA ligase 7-like n=1 Tax=Tropilaelaps mercedesae TaxID=418985 RepID=A0A1V9X4C7_9ACAR|nr:4-coumarate--CoA ligase 7-like [Tropilaelaps mercedesae]